MDNRYSPKLHTSAEAILNVITFPFEKLLAKSTSLSKLIVKGCFFAFFFLLCCSAVEFIKPITKALF